MKMLTRKNLKYILYNTTYVYNLFFKTIQSLDEL